MKNLRVSFRKLAFAVITLGLPAAASAVPCSPLTDHAMIRICASDEDLVEEESTVARPLVVMPGHVAPIDGYRKAVYRLSRSAKITPLLFAGAPPESPNPAGRDRRAQERTKVLRSGYLYTLDADEARRWHRKLGLADLFDEPTVVLRRGDQEHRLVRQDGRYVYTDGELAGREARLLVFDRVAVSSEDFGPPAAFDLEGLRQELGVRTFDVESIDTRRAEVIAHFANGSSAAGVVVHDGAQTLLLTVGSTEEALARAVGESLPIVGVERGILATAELMAAERLKFDEPTVEIGQQDGEVRRTWWRAYKQGKDRFVINGHRYRVFDRQGRPDVPQVCIDFIMDAIDRFGGSWYGSRDEPRRRSEGLIELRKVVGYNRRLVPDVIRMAQERPDIWDAYKVPDEDRIPWRSHERFFEHLATFPVDLHEADVIVIWGKRADQRNHYHSYFVHKTDPVYGYPIVFSDNAGYARVRVIDEIMRPAPRRYVLWRLRLRPEWVISRMKELRVKRAREEESSGTGACAD